MMAQGVRHLIYLVEEVLAILLSVVGLMLFIVLLQIVVHLVVEELQLTIMFLSLILTLVVVVLIIHVILNLVDRLVMYVVYVVVDFVMFHLGVIVQEEMDHIQQLIFIIVGMEKSMLQSNKIQL